MHFINVRLRRPGSSNHPDAIAHAIGSGYFPRNNPRLYGEKTLEICSKIAI